MATLIYLFADIMARPLAFMALSAGSIGLATLGASLGFGDRFWTGLNLFISVSTMIIGQAVLCVSRRDGIAVDLKLDRIIEEQPGENDAIGAERHDAEVLLQKKKEIEERTK